MTDLRDVKITGTGMALPKKIVTNDDLVKGGLDTSDEWIVNHIGIHSRRIASGDESTVSLGVKAARHALKNAGIMPQDVEFIISTGIPSVPCPSDASLFQQELGAEGAATLDISNFCSGFNYALSICRRFIADRSFENAMIVSSELISRYVDWTDRTTCVFFSDGAGAVVVEPSKKPGILSDHLGTSLGNKEALTALGGGTKFPPSHETIDKGLYYVRMNGKEVWNFAVNAFPYTVKKALDKSGLTTDDVDFLISHQANLRLIEYCMNELGLPMSKTHTTVEKYGNTVTASIPITLHEALNEGKIKEGDTVVLVGFGASLAYGANVLNWVD